LEKIRKKEAGKTKAFCPQIPQIKKIKGAGKIGSIHIFRRRRDLAKSFNFWQARAVIP
jgi:hypothetical protein